MKLRLAGQSVRLRLTHEDVETFAGAGEVAAGLALGEPAGGTLRYALVASTEVGELEARLSSDGLEVLVPAKQAATWAAGDEVGLYGTADGVKITVEKDLGCSHEADGSP